MNLSKQLKNRVRESGIVAIDLIVADFALQFARQFGLPCKKGVNIRMLSHYEGLVNVSVLILDLGRNNDFHFCIQENAREKTWEACCLYPVYLSFDLEDIPTGFKHLNSFRAERDKTGKYTFINLTDN